MCANRKPTPFQHLQLLEQAYGIISGSVQVKQPRRLQLTVCWLFVASSRRPPAAWLWLVSVGLGLGLTVATPSSKLQLVPQVNKPNGFDGYLNMNSLINFISLLNSSYIRFSTVLMYDIMSAYSQSHYTAAQSHPSIISWWRRVRSGLSRSGSLPKADLVLFWAPPQRAI